MTSNLVSRQDLSPLLSARSVAVVGISQLPRFGGRVYQNLCDFGYRERGRIYGVNPKYATLFDRPCYPSLRDLPERPDLAILALPNDRLLAALQEAAAIGVPAAVIQASAYSNPVDGQPTLQRQLAEAARAGGIVLCGPNCMGFVAAAQRLVASGYELPPLPGGDVTFITHSGSVFDTVWQNRRGVRFNYLVSSGNEIVTTLADYMHFALNDPTTRVIGLFLETVRDPETFRAALEAAAEQDVPVVALKVGRSERGAQLAQAHSGALAGQDAAYDALFAHYGMQRVKTLDEMLDTLELFAAGLRPRSRYITSIHDSGGERGLLVDLAEAEGVHFAPIDAETTAHLGTIIEPGLAPLNPLDAWGTGNDFDRIYLDGLLALDSDPATGLNVWVADLYASGIVSETYVNTAIAHRARFRHPLVFLSNLASAASEALASRLREAGIPALMGTENGLRAIRHLMDYGEFQRQRLSGKPEPPAVTLPAEQVLSLRQTLQAAAGPLDEYASKALLRAYGIATPDEAVVESLTAAQQAALRTGYPVALKTAAGELHKSDRGGVVLNLANADAVARAYRAFEERFGPRVLVQAMVPAGVELILGLARDAQFGLMLTIGLGGIFVEVLRDVRRLALPPRREAVREALLGLRGAPLLEGIRGQPPADIDAIVDAALRLAAFAHDLGDHVAALDINPLIALPDRAVAVDALIIPKHTVRDEEPA
jgi:acyl-CoA synthetase (NDP forming)